MLTAQAGIPHGSESGYREGCRSRGGCPNWSSTRWMTCVEAIAARRGDYGMRKLASNEPVPRRATQPAKAAPGPSGVRTPTAQVSPNRRTAPARSAIVHGTSAGYLRGCRDDANCPHDGDQSCREARNASRRMSARARGVKQKEAVVDAAPLQTCLRTAVEQGSSLRALARHAGIGHTTMNNIARGVYSEIRASTARKVLHVLALGD